MSGHGEPRRDRVMVFGANGYIGRHLVQKLCLRGRLVRAVARRRSALEAEAWNDVELAVADALEPASLPPVLEGVSVAYYLVHSMASGPDFVTRDRQAAANFAAAADLAGIERIVYLGGLAPHEPDTQHLASRVETGDILRQGHTPVTEVRAGIIVGPGSAAFEVMRDLVAHLPVMVTPRWVRSQSPPVALDQVLGYLVDVADKEPASGQVFEAAGPERLSYEQMMRILARKLGRREPLIIPVPVLTPNLSSYWLGFITTVPTPVGRALIGGLKHDLTADDGALRKLAPQPEIGFEEAIDRTFAAEREIHASVGWRDGAFELRGRRHDVSFYGKVMSFVAPSAASPENVWTVLSGIGTQAQGYFYADWIWRLRIFMDRLVGGNSASRRPAQSELRVGTRFDFWRVLAMAKPRRLTLISSLIAPGVGGLQFDIDGKPGEQPTALTVTLHWHPAGFYGVLYWYLLWPAHVYVLKRMVRAICRRAETI